ncbi:MAG TPA: GNAT family N-acetyltransferase [Candidatus Saccharimonadales bacterium]|nr:GNAT family N-acetyltransferase [Candidatus Saccharimonadales bacterium]
MFVAIVTFKPLGMNWIIIRFSCREFLTGLNPLYTYFLGREEIKAYATDFAQRLLAFGEQFPYIWCTLGYSGEELAIVVAESLPHEIRMKIQIIPINYDRDRRKILFQNPHDKKAFRSEEAVLVMDSSVHSGSTMLAAFNKLLGLSVKNICSYSLVLKRGSCFIPNLFGLLIQEYDRAYFLLDRIPNHRIIPFGALRTLVQSDTKRRQKRIRSGLSSIDKMTWADLWYETKTAGKTVFVYEESGKILAFISFLIKKGHLFIDAIAVDKNQQGRGLGGHLMRWAETSARIACCSKIKLWAIDNRVKFYQEKAGFTLRSEQLDLGTEKYRQMERTLLYNMDRNVNELT